MMIVLLVIAGIVFMAFGQKGVKTLVNVAWIGFFVLVLGCFSIYLSASKDTKANAAFENAVAMRNKDSLYWEALNHPDPHNNPDPEHLFYRDGAWVSKPYVAPSH